MLKRCGTKQVQTPSLSACAASLTAIIQALEQRGIDPSVTSGNLRKPLSPQVHSVASACYRASDTHLGVVLQGAGGFSIVRRRYGGGVACTLSANPVCCTESDAT